MNLSHFFAPSLALLLAPLLPGIINRTKALVAGRRGPPLLQPYRDILKLLRRGTVYGEVTTAIVRLSRRASRRLASFGVTRGGRGAVT